MGLILDEDRYVEIGYIDDQDDYISWGPVVYWEQKVIVIPRNMLEWLNGSTYQVDMLLLKHHLNFLEASEEGIPHDKILYHETETMLSGVNYARKIMFINNYTVTFENGVYAVNLYGANHNLMDVLNMNSVSVRAQNSAGLQTIHTGASVLSTEERNKLMSIDTITADEVWGYNGKTIDQQTGLTLEEHQQLMASPTTEDIANKVWIVEGRSLDAAVGLTVEEHDKLMAVPDSGTIANNVWDSSVTSVPARIDEVKVTVDTLATADAVSAVKSVVDSIKTVVDAIPVETLTPEQRDKLMSLVNTDLAEVNSKLDAVPTAVWNKVV